jgi:ferredoxin-NADP reductase
VSAIASAPRIVWRLATVVDVVSETTRARTVFLDVPGWPGHRAGQHVDVRLTAEDGYQTERSYSIASPPEESRIALTIERLEEGEVSPYLVDELRTGDQIEIRGPIGGYFVWDISLGGPLLLLAGGSGIVPLMAMLRHRDAALAKSGAKARDAVPARLVYSSRRWDEVIYRDELAVLSKKDNALEIVHTLTRAAPTDWKGYTRRIDPMMLEEVAWPATQMPQIFVCGPTPFVESAAATLVDLGHEAARVKTERFGPTGSSTSAS